MSDSKQSIEKFLKEIDEQVAKLPPGSDLAGFITQKHREMGEMLARRVGFFPLSNAPTVDTK